MLASLQTSMNVIGKNLKNQIGSGSLSPSENVEALLRAVENSIETSPSSYNVFVECLSEEPVFSNVVEELNDVKKQEIQLQGIGKLVQL